MCNPDELSVENSDLMSLVFKLLQHDFCEDNDMVQGNWKFEQHGDIFTIEYDPFPDSPFPAKTMRYRVASIPDGPPEPPQQPPTRTPDWRDDLPGLSAWQV